MQEEDRMRPEVADQYAEDFLRKNRNVRLGKDFSVYYDSDRKEFARVTDTAVNQGHDSSFGNTTGREFYTQETKSALEAKKEIAEALAITNELRSSRKTVEEERLALRKEREAAQAEEALAREKVKAAKAQDTIRVDKIAKLNQEIDAKKKEMTQLQREITLANLAVDATAGVIDDKVSLDDADFQSSSTSTLIPLITDSSKEEKSGSGESASNVAAKVQEPLLETETLLSRRSRRRHKNSVESSEVVRAKAEISKWQQILKDSRTQQEGPMRS